MAVVTKLKVSHTAQVAIGATRGECLLENSEQVSKNKKQMHKCALKMGNDGQEFKIRGMVLIGL